MNENNNESNKSKYIAPIIIGVMLVGLVGLGVKVYTPSINEKSTNQNTSNMIEVKILTTEPVLINSIELDLSERECFVSESQKKFVKKDNGYTSYFTYLDTTKPLNPGFDKVGYKNVTDFIDNKTTLESANVISGFRNECVGGALSKPLVDISADNTFNISNVEKSRSTINLDQSGLTYQSVASRGNWLILLTIKNDNTDKNYDQSIAECGGNTNLDKVCLEDKMKNEMFRSDINVAIKNTINSFKFN